MEPNRPHMKTKLPAAIVALALLNAFQASALVTITRHPADQVASLGAHVTLEVTASSTAPPITYQWYGRGSLLPGQTSRTLVLNNIQLDQAGDYYVDVNDAENQPVQSNPATVTVDPTFIKITEGALVTDVEMSTGAVWWDADNDGDLDVVVTRMADHGPGVTQSFYHNNGDGTFTKISDNAVAQTLKRCGIGTVGDYDNDGDQDIYLSSNNWGANEPVDDLFRNDGGGRFSALLGEPWRSDQDHSHDCSFVDVDQDGMLDVLVLNYDQPLCLYRQTNLGRFVKWTPATAGSILSNPGHSFNAAWTDFDGDGDLDLWTNNEIGSSRLHQNNGKGFFTLVTPPSMAQSPGGTGLWADFDNDGYPELFVGGYTESGPRANALYRGVAGQNFANVAGQSGVAVIMSAGPSAAGDYDNDGWLDLFVANWEGGKTNVLFHNRRDGSFEAVDLGSLIRDGSERSHVTWVDYDNDGCLDLLLVCGYAPSPARANHLFRNNSRAIGNANHWLKVKLIGQASNRSGIGAKICVKATIGGQEIWQVREMTGNGYSQTCPGLIAHFGLSDATQADIVRVEWPSGIVQTLTNVMAGQPGQPPLLVTEHQEYSGAAPAFSGASFLPAGFDLAIAEPSTGAVYVLEGSTDLATWTKLMVRGGAGGTYEWADEQASNQSTRFYRLVVP